MSSKSKVYNYSSCPLTLTETSSLSCKVYSFGANGQNSVVQKYMDYDASTFFNAIVDGKRCACVAGECADANIRILAFDIDNGSLHANHKTTGFDCLESSITSTQGTNAAIVGVKLGDYSMGLAIYPSNGTWLQTTIPICYDSSNLFRTKIKKGSVTKTCICVCGFKSDGTFKIYAFREDTGRLFNNIAYRPAEGKTFYETANVTSSTTSSRVIVVPNVLVDTIIDADIFTIGYNEGNIIRRSDVDLSTVYLEHSKGYVSSSGRANVDLQYCTIISGLNMNLTGAVYMAFDLDARLHRSYTRTP